VTRDSSLKDGNIQWLFLSGKNKANIGEAKTNILAQHSQRLGNLAAVPGGLPSLEGSKKKKL
jgi:hypothetical protein